jgi:hypothetical protein
MVDAKWSGITIKTKKEKNKRVCHSLALPFAFIKKYLKAKEEEL